MADNQGDNQKHGTDEAVEAAAKKPSSRRRHRPRRRKNESSKQANNRKEEDERSNGDSDPSKEEPAPASQQNEKKKKNRRNRRTNQHDNNGRSDTTNTNKNKPYPPHWTLDECLDRYNESTEDNVTVIRGKLRVLPGKDQTASSFVACDRGWLKRDVMVEDSYHRNRAMDGDLVFVELNPVEDNENELSQKLQDKAQISSSQGDDEEQEQVRTWQDDEIQMDLWNPQVTMVRKERKHVVSGNPNRLSSQSQLQRKGRVVYVVPPKPVVSELEPDSSDNRKKAPLPRRRIVGSIMVLQSGTILLTPNNRSLPQFKCPQPTKNLIDLLQKERDKQEADSDENDHEPVLKRTLFRADYVYGSWKESHKQWPPCVNVEKLGDVGDMEDEIQALLSEFQVDHGEFPAQALKDVDHAVHSGVFHDPYT